MYLPGADSCVLVFDVNVATTLARISPCISLHLPTSPYLRRQRRQDLGSNPDPDPDPNPNPSPDPTPSPTPNPDPKPSPNPDPNPNPNPDPNTNPNLDPNPNPNPDPNPDPNANPNQVAKTFENLDSWRDEFLIQAEV